jgi:hypothetical protein
MADFLERVARVALGVAPAIKPMVVSRYAPGASGPVPEALAREVTLDIPAVSVPTSLAEHQARSTPSVPPADPLGRRPPTQAAPETAAIDSDEHRLQPAHVLEPPRPALARAPAAGDASSAIAPVPVDVSMSQRTLIDTGQVHDFADDTRTREQPPLTDAQRQPLPPAIVGEPRPDITRRVADAGRVRSAPDRPLAGVEPSFAAGRMEAVDQRTVPMRVRDDSDHPRPLIDVIEPRATTGDRADAAATMASMPRELARRSSPPVEAESEIHEPPIRPQTTLPKSLSPESEPATSRRAQVEIRAPRQSESDHAASRPVVRVTIGRVEVRAVMPPSAPVAAPAAPSPKLSLDEYLRQQSGRPR